MATLATGSVILTVLAILHGAESFGIPDFLNLEKSFVARDTSSDTQALANVVVDVGLRLADIDGNGVITFEEVESSYQRKMDAMNPPGSTPHSHENDARGYLMTLVVLADTDDSQALERNELDKVAQTLIAEAGGRQAGKVIYAETELGFQTGDIPLPGADGMVDVVLQAMDANDDKILALDELGAFYSLDRFHWSSGVAHRYFSEADENLDNKLDRREIVEWIKKLTADGMYHARRVFTYARVKQFVGEEMANGLVNY